MALAQDSDQPPLLSRGEIVVPHEWHGLRLDQMLMRAVSGLGRRGARRLCEQCFVLVDDRLEAPGKRVQTGQRIRLLPRAGENSTGQCRKAEELQVEVATSDESYAALIKPSGMHSETIAGSVGPSLEAMLPRLFPGMSPILVNRLDQSVSGLVLAALAEPAARKYKTWQEQGLVSKWYLAVVRGRLSGETPIRYALDTAKRRKVRLLSGLEPDPLRWTRVSPIFHHDERDQSLVLVKILKGRRHQIRAHLAGIGHPVIQDPLYGAGPDLGWIYLHHCRIDLPEFSAAAVPDWDEWRKEADWKAFAPERSV